LLTWTEASEQWQTPNSEHYSPENSLVSWKIVEQKGNEVIKRNLSWNQDHKARIEGISVRRLTYVE